VHPLNKHANQPLQGWLFGGNLTSLSKIIGTEYFPSSLKGSILFLEDNVLSSTKLLRQYMQWVLMGLLDDVSAIVFGTFTAQGASVTDNITWLIDQFVNNVDIPCYKTNGFGKISTTHPLQYGAEAKLGKNSFSWSYKPLTRGKQHQIAS
jgi:muramoyltetrapeptide carboxypeptidase